MGSMGLIRQSNDMENDDTEVFSSEWVVERILEKRTVNGKVFGKSFHFMRSIPFHRK